MTDTPAPTPRCDDCGAPLNEGTAKTFTVCDRCWDRHYAKHRTAADAALAASGRGMTADTLTAQLAASEAARERAEAELHHVLRDIDPEHDNDAIWQAADVVREWSTDVMGQLNQVTADLAAVRATVAVRTAREHRAGCPALHAWDVPGACVCDNPKISRCGVCGHRVAHPAPDAGGRNG